MRIILQRLDAAAHPDDLKLHGRSSISPEMALRLAKFLQTSMDIWMNLQTQYDIWFMQQKTHKIKVKPFKEAA